MPISLKRAYETPSRSDGCPLTAQANASSLTFVKTVLCRASTAGRKSSSSMTKLTFTRGAPWEITLIIDVLNGRGDLADVKPHTREPARCLW